MFSAKKHFHQLLPGIFLLFSVLLVSCALPGTNPPAPHFVKAPAGKQIYTIPEVGMADINTLDPALAHDVASINAIQLYATGLVQLDDKLQVQPQLAASWSQSPDGTTWTFHLKPNLKFSDGTPLTSADIAYSIDRALQPATQSTVAPIYLGLIKDSDTLLAGRITTLIGDSLQTPDANTLVIVTKKKATYFLAMLTTTCSYVVEKKLITTYGNKFTDHLYEGGSAGPFKLSLYTHGKQIDFVPNPYYYKKQPQLQHVRLVFFHSTDAVYQSYMSGQVDTTGIPLSTYTNDKKRKDFVQQPQLWINYYTMNYLVKPFDNIHIRQAFALAIDKNAIAKNVWKNTVVPTNHIVPQGMPGYNPGLNGPDGTQTMSGDAAKAQTLLKQGIQEEGWSGVSQLPAITLTYASGQSSFDQEVKAMTQMWQKVLGVSVTPNAIDYNTLLDQVTAATNNPDGLQFWGLAWIGEYPDPQDWLSLQFANGVPNNNMNYGQNTSLTANQQQTIQQQLAVADGTTDTRTRIQEYQQAEQQLVNDVAWLPMEQVTLPFLRTQYVVGFVDNAQGIIPPDDWATIYKVQPQ